MTPTEKSGKNSPLKPHEWCAVASFFFFIITLFFYTSFYHTDNENNLLSVAQEPYQVLLKGSVELQGIYLIPKTIKLNELLDISKATAEAELRQINLNREIPKGGVINIPKKKGNKPKARRVLDAAKGR